VRRSSEPRSARAKGALALVALAATLIAGWALRRAPRGEPAARLADERAPPPQPAQTASTRHAPPPAPRGGDALNRLRTLVGSDPAAALALAREDEDRSPDGPLADERSFRAMQALVHLGRIAAARDEATAFFEKHPESAWGERVERLTGVHPRRFYQNFR
jgi:hypothetical protein